MDPITIAAIMGGSGVLGGLGNYFAGQDQAKANSSAIKYLTGLQSNINDQTQGLVSDLNTAYSPYTANAASDYGALRNAITGANYQQYAPTESFDYDLNSAIDSFMNPNVDYLVDQATNAVENSAANAGNLFSGQTGKAIVQQAQDIAQKYRSEAQDLALQDRNFQYQNYQDTISNNRSAIDQANSLLNNSISNLGTLSSMGQNAVTGLANQSTDLWSNAYGDINNIGSVIGQLKSQSSPSLFSSVLGGLGSAGAGLGSIMGQQKK